MKTSYRMFLLAGAMLSGCRSSDPMAPRSSGELTPPTLDRAAPAGDARSTDRLPTDQLARVRAATARYQDLDNALADGYVDIDVVVPNMGRHYLKPALLDAQFELERPELLVYSPDDNGRMKLVAVEYAVPLALAASPPEGFRGSADQWSANQQFQLWTLHAWVWKENPDGMFNSTNPTVR